MVGVADKQMVVGLDIGTSKIVAIVAEIDEDGSVELIALGSHPSQGLKTVSYTHLTLPTKA